MIDRAELRRRLQPGAGTIGFQVTAEFWNNTFQTSYGREINELLETFQKPRQYIQPLNVELQRSLKDNPSDLIRRALDGPIPVPLGSKDNRSFDALPEPYRPLAAIPPGRMALELPRLISPGISRLVEEDLIPPVEDLVLPWKNNPKITVEANLELCLSTGYSLEGAITDRLNGIGERELVQKLKENEVEYLIWGLSSRAAGRFDLAEQIRPFGEAILAGNPVFVLTGTKCGVSLTA